ncbi:MAG: CBS domain-containing protein [Acidobacteriota bacterium]|nr:MAG: CBS domain-containing protein [Acidobacteriota bacterium]
MKVQDLMTTGVGTCRVDDSAEQGAHIMWDQDCGAIPVVDQDSRVLGMVTDRDLCMAAFTQGRPLGDVRIESAMSKELWICHPGDDVEAAEAVMKSHRIRRLPVIDEREQLVGILSLCDLAREALREAGSRSRSKEVKSADIGETLGAITGTEWIPARPA